MKLIDGDYQVEYSSEYDNGYGIESATDDVMIYIVNGEIDEIIAYGMHHTTELEVDWPVDLTDTEVVELLQKFHPSAIDDSIDLDAEADKAIKLYKENNHG